ncbi:hypothetical protein DFR70_108262 [Nocardia tenerifensis]|uniref:Uncharacterized protein n=2 Tax=Nocardia tenerifensis TaxID=228006 RepID=A0A318K2J2_9NOCA|nr:hypothetical protein [Nocardia tenerifensis]PXX61704.1 hypothetical protein DFR70_108262 [Nocardia tenerifensis]
MTAHHLAAPLSPTVLDAIRNTPVAPFLDRPAEQLLAQIGLPPLPQLPALPPLPGLPPLPALDPMALMKPVTDLFSGFGDGNLRANGSLDPHSVLQKVTQSIGTAVQLATAGIQLLQSMQSAGSRAATSAAVETVGTATSLSGQATHMNAVTAAAAGTVATGYLQMAALAARFAATTAALSLTLATPAGQAALLGTAIEAAAEAIAITAHTKVQLIGHAGQMTQAGTPVPVRKPVMPKLGGVGKAQQALVKGLKLGDMTRIPGVPPAHAVSGMSARSASAAATGDSGSQVVQQVMQMVQPLIAATRQVGQEVVAHPPAKPPTEAVVPEAVPVETKPLAIAPFGPMYTAAAPVTSAAVPLGGWQTEAVVTATPGVSTGPATVAASTRFAGEVLPPLVPGMGALATAAERSRAVDGTADAMVDARHVDELVGGVPPETAAPVIGAAPAATPDNPYSL